MALQLPDGLVVQRHDRHVVVWLDWPEKRNAITAPMRDALATLFEELDTDPEVRAIVLRGRGGNFCAGADLARVQGDMDGDDALDRIHAGSSVLARVAAIGTPTVAVVEGYAIAGGFELLLACDFALAAHDAKIGDFHIARGLVAGAGPLYRLPRIVGVRRAKDLMLRARLLSAAEAEEWGLVNETVTETQDLEAVVTAFVATLTDKSPVAIRATKRALGQSLDSDADSMRLIERLTVGEVFGSQDAREGVAAFLERRPPQWIGR